jgi:hypothetical protein
MKIINTAIILAFAILGTISTSSAAEARNKTIELPAGCEKIAVEEGNKLAFKSYATGVQVYRWNGTSWAFVAPIANLYADEGFNGQIGTHYAGPTWEGNGGSKVVAARVDGCSPDPTAIQWLLLRAVTADGPGIFHRISFIQRLNTVGGIAPSTPGANVGDEARVPYTTEYYFYRSKNN